MEWTTETQRASLEDAIAAVEAQRGVLGDAIATTVLAALRRQLAELESEQTTLEAERKLVTILFADLAGFTAFSERSDPEDVRGLMNACFGHLAPVIQTYGGTIERFLGDAMVALFGAPVTHENDSERALRAALGLMDALHAFNATHGTSLEMHIGVNTGLVVVGGVGSPGRQQYSVMGDAINLASRLDDAAAAGEILVGPETYRLAGAWFDFEAQAPVVIKGKAEPVVAYKLLRARTGQASLRGVEGLRSPMVGRDQELAALVQALMSLRHGEGGAVAVVGEAGLGKSRLLAEARALVEDEVRWIEANCVAHAQETSYGVVRSTLLALAPLDGNADDGALLLRHALKQVVPDRASALFPYLARLLDLPLDTLVNDSLVLLSADVLQQRMVDALVEYVRAYALRQPLVLVWEDLQWLDPSSLGVLEALLHATSNAPLLICVAYRPGEGRLASALERLSGEAWFDAITLHALADDDGARLLGNLLDGADISSETTDLFLGKAEGNPFYLEEMVRVLLDDGVIVRQHDRSIVVRPITRLDVPNTLQGLIMARIDHLPAQHKRVLQTAAIIGRVFERRVLGHLVRADMGDAELEAFLLDLERREFLERREDEGESVYAFKHTLIQQTAYNSLLIARRTQLHAEVGDAIETLFPDALHERAAMLGSHFEQGGVAHKAVPYLVRAGDAAREIYANAEAMAFYRAAIKQLEPLRGDEEDTQWDDLATQLREHIGDILLLIGQNDAARRAYRDALVQAPPRDPLWASRLYRKAGKVWEVLHGYDEALELYALAERTLHEVEARGEGWWREHVQLLLERMFVHYWRAEVDELDALATQTQPLVEQYGTSQQRANFFLQRANSAVRRDRYVIGEQTLHYSRKAVRASEEECDLLTLGWARFVLAGCLFFAGELDEAESYFQATLLIVERTGDIVHQSRCLNYLTLIRRLHGEVDAAYEMANRALETATSGQMLEYIALARANLAWVAWRDGQHAEVAAHAQAALGLWRQTPVVYPLQWAATLPLLALALDERHLPDAVEHTRALLAPTQQLLPTPITDALERALAADADEATLHDTLYEALHAAQKHGYL
jgi:class 3 adenylate cyclase/tetratricopeptide (TPR) repeat protein